MKLVQNFLHTWVNPYVHSMNHSVTVYTLSKVIKWKFLEASTMNLYLCAKEMYWQHRFILNCQTMLDSTSILYL